MGAGFGGMGGGGQAGSYSQASMQGAGLVLGAAGDILTSFGDTAQAKWPKPFARERRYRNQTNQLLDEARRVTEAGVGLSGELTPLLLADLGYDFDTIDQRPQLQQSLAQLTEAQGRLAGLRGQKGKGIKKQKKRARKDLRLALNRTGQLQAQPVQVMNLRRKAATAEELANRRIQDALAARTESALRGETDNPRLLRELEDQWRNLNETYRRQTGEGYATSSPFREARSDFLQRKAELLDASNRADIEGMRRLQLGSAATLEDLAGSRQNRTYGISREGLLAGSQLGDLTSRYLQAQQPFQFDREGMLRASLANKGDPDRMTKIGYGLINSSDRLMQASQQ